MPLSSFKMTEKDKGNYYQENAVTSFSWKTKRHHKNPSVNLLPLLFFNRPDKNYNYVISSWKKIFQQCLLLQTFPLFSHSLIHSSVPSVRRHFFTVWQRCIKFPFCISCSRCLTWTTCMFENKLLLWALTGMCIKSVNSSFFLANHFFSFPQSHNIYLLPLVFLSPFYYFAKRGRKFLRILGRFYSI